MINKKSLWFLTLFSLILVLSVYYVTMPNELLLTNNNDYIANTSILTDNSTNDEKEVNTTVEESELLVALRVEADETLETELNKLKTILTSKDSSIEEKNEAFENMKALNDLKAFEKELEDKINNELNLKSFVKIDGDQVRVTVDSAEHDVDIASKIMHLIQSNYQKKMYITVKFQT